MQRVVFLVDMNAFFISCEITRDNSLFGVPAAVAGDPKKRTGIILAANYEARAFGVKTAMLLAEALRLCPEMIIVPPNHALYEQKSKEVIELLSHYSPIVEQNSIDEAWLDMTGTEALFGKPADAANLIMDEIKDKLGLWCSIGIAENKFLSKMASDMKKPLGITALWNDQIQEKLWPLPVVEIYGVGEKTTAKLKNLGIQTIGDLAKFDKNILVKVLGKYGTEIYQHANGIDDSPVVVHKEGEMKSIGREITLSEDISNIDKAKRVILELVDDVAMTARNYDKKGHTVAIKLKYSDFHSITRQITIPASNSTKAIYISGCTLLEKNWDTKHPVRLLGISLSGFDDLESSQISFFEENPESTRQESKNDRLYKAIDEIRSRHGGESIKQAWLIEKEEDD